MRRAFGLFFMICIPLFSCQSASNQTPEGGSITAETFTQDWSLDSLEIATFTGGHFYALETAFEQVRGVEKVLTGFIGGNQPEPSYESVLKGDTKHQMGIQVYFNPEKITYVMLLAIYFAAHDPTTADRQGIESGAQFSPIIYYHSEQQKKFAEKQIATENKKSKYEGKKIITGTKPYDTFWVAPPQHQDFAVNHKADEYVVNVVKPYLRRVEQKYGAWMLKVKALFPEDDDQPQAPNDSKG